MVAVMSRSLLKVMVVIVALGMFGWGAATVFAGEDGARDPSEPAPSKSPYDPPPARGYESPDVPMYAPGAATVVPPSDPAARQGNPTGDPNVRVCKFPDGSLVQIIVSPVDPKNPFPPGDRTRPC